MLSYDFDATLINHVKLRNKTVDTQTKCGSFPIVIMWEIWRQENTQWTPHANSHSHTKMLGVKSS